jgi:hypothetical protein
MQLCAVSALVSEIREMIRVKGWPWLIKCRFERTTESGARVHRYFLIETASQVFQRELPFSGKETA